MMTHRQKGILEWERAFERAEARARGSRPRIEVSFEAWQRQCAPTFQATTAAQPTADRHRRA
jgi:hypothetical protein